MSGFNFFDMLGWSPLSPRINWPPQDDSGIPAWMRDELVGGGGDDAPGRALTQKQQHDAEIAAGIRTTLPPDTQFNSKGFAVSPDLSDTLPGQRISAPVLKPELGRGMELRLAGGPPPPATPAPASPPPPAAPPAGPVPRSLSPELYRPLDLRSTMPDPAAPPPAPAAPGPAIVPPAMPGAAPPPGPLAKPPGPPAAAVPGVLAGQRPGGLGGILGIFGGGGGMTGPDGKELTTDQMMDRLLRMQLQKAMMPDWGAMAAAFAEAGKPSLLPTGGMGAALGKAAGAMSGGGKGGGRDAFSIIEIMQKVQDAKEKSASRKELGATLKEIDAELAKRRSGTRINTTTGAIIPAPSSAGDGAAAGAPPVKVEPLSGEAVPADSGDDIDRSLSLIEKYESGGRNVMQGVVGPQGGYNPSVGRVTGPSSAGGYYQMIDPTWRDAASRTAPVQIGDTTYNPSDFSKAIQAPREVQTAVARQLFKEKGWTPWAPYNANLRAAIARGDRGGGTQVASAGGMPYMTAADAGGGGDDGGGAGYDDALALLLARLGAQSQLAGFGDIAKPYSEYLYNQPGYKGAVEAAQTRARETEKEPFDIRREQRGEGTQTRIEELKDRLQREAKEAEQRRQADLTIAPREQWPWEMGPNGQPQQRPITVGELAQRYRYFGPQAAPAAPAAPAGPIVPPGAAPAGPIPLPGAAPATPDLGGGMRGGGALPLARPMAPTAGPAAPAPAPAAGGGPPGGYSLPSPLPASEVPKDHRQVYRPDKQTWEVEPIPGSPTYKALLERDASELQVANRGIQSIDRALELSTDWSTGFKGARLAGWEGTGAYNLSAELVQLKALTSFAELQKMRSQNPTGAALGAVSDTEGKKLESTLTTLDQFQSKDKVDASLRRLKEEYLDTVYGSREKIEGLVREGKVSQRVADSVEALKARVLAPPAAPGGTQPGGAAQGPPTNTQTLNGRTYRSWDNGKTWHY